MSKKNSKSKIFCMSLLVIYILFSSKTGIKSQNIETQTINTNFIQNENSDSIKNFDFFEVSNYNDKDLINDFIKLNHMINSNKSNQNETIIETSSLDLKSVSLLNSIESNLISDSDYINSLYFNALTICNIDKNSHSSFLNEIKNYL